MLEERPFPDVSNILESPVPNETSMYNQSHAHTMTSTMENIESSEVPVSDSEEPERVVHKLSVHWVSKTNPSKFIPAADYVSVKSRRTTCFSNILLGSFEPSSVKGNYNKQTKVTVDKMFETTRGEKMIRFDLEENNTDELKVEQEGDTLAPNNTTNNLKPYVPCHTFNELNKKKPPRKKYAALLLAETKHDDWLPKYEPEEKLWDYENLKQHMEDVFNSKEQYVVEEIKVQKRREGLLRELLGKVDEIGQFVLPLHEHYQESLGLGFVKRMAYEKKLEEYYEAVERTREIVKKAMEEAIQATWRKKELSSVWEKTVERLDWKRRRLKMCIFNTPSIVM